MSPQFPGSSPAIVLTSDLCGEGRREVMGSYEKVMTSGDDIISHTMEKRDNLGVELLLTVKKSYFPL